MKKEYEVVIERAVTRTVGVFRQVITVEAESSSAAQEEALRVARDKKYPEYGEYFDIERDDYTESTRDPYVANEDELYELDDEDEADLHVYRCKECGHPNYLTTEDVDRAESEGLRCRSCGKEQYFEITKLESEAQ